MKVSLLEVLVGEIFIRNYVETNRLNYDKSKPLLTRLLTKVIYLISHFAFMMPIDTSKLST